MLHYVAHFFLPTDLILSISSQIHEASHLTLRGLHCYQGALQHVRSWAERTALLEQVVAKSAASRTALENAGLPCDLITGCGTGTFQIEGSLGVHGECQAGSYLFMDADYGRNLSREGAADADFEHSLFVHVKVISRVADGSRLVLDAGLKVMFLI